MFSCSQKPTKQKKSQSSNSSTNQNKTNNNTSSNLLRYVTKRYRPQVGADGFLSVDPGDFVVYCEEHESQKLTLVFHMLTQECGYVPSDILTTPQVFLGNKKKLPSTGSSLPTTINRPTTAKTITTISDAVKLVATSSTSIDNQTNTQSSNQKHLFPYFQERACSSSKQSCCHDPHFNVPDPCFSEASPSISASVFERRDFGLYLVLSNFTARQENDVGVMPLEKVRVLNKDDNEWYWIMRECDGKEGFVPATYLCRFDIIERKMREREAYSSETTRSVHDDSQPTYINTLPD